MKDMFRRGVAIAVIVLVVGIVVSPFVDLPLTTTRAWERLVISVLSLVAAVLGLTASSWLFSPPRRWERRPSQHGREIYRGDALSLNVARLC